MIKNIYNALSKHLFTYLNYASANNYISIIMGSSQVSSLSDTPSLAIMSYAENVILPRTC